MRVCVCVCMWRTRWPLFRIDEGKIFYDAVEETETAATAAVETKCDAFDIKHTKYTWIFYKQTFSMAHTYARIQCVYVCVCAYAYM